MTAPFRIGLGYDVHRFNPDRPLILGGFKLPEGPGLDGHSDADVLTHALSDAILGALGKPDIGHFYPPSDPRWKNLDSRVILNECWEKATGAGWSIGNCDCVIIAEKPKLGPHRRSIQASLAALLQIEEACIGIKATTHEGLGAIGRGEGMAASASVLLYRP